MGIIISVPKTNFIYSKIPANSHTHLNYLANLSAISSGISIECRISEQKRINESEELNNKIKLLKLTKINLDEEFKMIKSFPNFAQSSVSWVSIKSYYLFFNLLLIMEYLIWPDEAVFKKSHKKTMSTFVKYIKEGNIIFNKSLFNVILSCYEALNFKAKPGENLKILNVDPERRIKQTLKKIVRYKLNELRKENNFPNFRKKKAKEKRTELLNSDVHICEFFYWYRIRANYWDLDFLCEQNINSKYFVMFYENYFKLIDNLYRAFKVIINKLAKIRLGKEIL